MYHTTRESVTCECGGRHSLIPAVLKRHQETKKHKQFIEGHTSRQYVYPLHERPSVSFEQKHTPEHKPIGQEKVCIS